MGILSELEKLNPATIIADIDAAKTKITEYETRIVSLETTIEALIGAVKVALPAIEAATVTLSPELTAALNAISRLTA